MLLAPPLLLALSLAPSDLGPWLGAHPVGALEAAASSDRLVITADLDAPDQVAWLLEAVEGLEGVDRPLRLVVIDRADRDADGLAWRLLELELLDAPAAFFPCRAAGAGLDGEDRSGSGWRFVPAARSCDPLGADATFADPCLEGSLVDAGQALGAIQVRLGSPPPGGAHDLGRREAGADGGAGTGAGAGPESAAAGASDQALAALAHEVRAAWRSGRPLDAAARLDELRRTQAGSARLASTLGALEFLIEGEVPVAALEQDRRLRRLLAQLVRSSDPERQRRELVDLACDREAVDEVRDRAARWALRVERFGRP